MTATVQESPISMANIDYSSICSCCCFLLLLWWWCINDKYTFPHLSSSFCALASHLNSVALVDPAFIILHIWSVLLLVLMWENRSWFPRVHTGNKVCLYTEREAMLHSQVVQSCRLCFFSVYIVSYSKHSCREADSCSMSAAGCPDDHKKEAVCH